MDNLLVTLVLFPLAAYVIGSTPFGVIIARAHGKDLRSAGSGNVGATNVARVMGRRWGYTCFVLEVSKGLGPVALEGHLLGTFDGDATPLQQASLLSVGFAVVMGHVLSFWLKFRGGKGVATSLGMVLGMWPYFTLAGLVALGVWTVVTLVSRYVSLGSIVAAVAFGPLFIAFNLQRWRQLWPLLAFAAVIVGMIVIRHRSNITRLLAGTENKIGTRKHAGDAEGREQSEPDA